MVWRRPSPPSALPSSASPPWPRRRASASSSPSATASPPAMASRRRKSYPALLAARLRAEGYPHQRRQRGRVGRHHRGRAPPGGLGAQAQAGDRAPRAGRQRRPPRPGSRPGARQSRRNGHALRGGRRARAPARHAAAAQLRHALRGRVRAASTKTWRDSAKSPSCPSSSTAWARWPRSTSPTGSIRPPRATASSSSASGPTSSPSSALKNRGVRPNMRAGSEAGGRPDP